jgi:hypothetical protein
MNRYWFYINVTHENGEHERKYDCAIRSSQTSARNILKKDYNYLGSRIGYTVDGLEFDEAEVL